MVLNDLSQTFLFTFRCNGETSEGGRLAEVLVEQLADYDVSVATDAYHRSWFGTEEAMIPMLKQLGFLDEDVRGVMAALLSHRGVDRKLAATPDQLSQAGFRQMTAS